MPDLYKITFNIAHNYGYIAFNETDGGIEVFFPDFATADKIKAWLTQEHEINTPDENGGLTDFSFKKYLVARSRRDLQTVLTRIWEQIGVHVDWSFPPEFI